MKVKFEIDVEKPGFELMRALGEQKQGFDLGEAFKGRIAIVKSISQKDSAEYDLSDQSIGVKHVGVKHAHGEIELLIIN